MIYAVSGHKGAGKSTVSGHILEENGGTRLSFADTLKGMLRVLLRDLGISEKDIFRYSVMDKEAVIPDLGVSYRHLAQTLGTEWGRTWVHPDLWVIVMQKKLERTFGDVVIDDVRFNNENEMLQEMGAVRLHVVDPNYASEDTHPSENALTLDGTEIVIINDKDGKDRLFHQLNEILEQRHG